MITDLTGKAADALKKKKLWLLDMDGTIYNENQIFEGTLDFLNQIRQNGGRYIFITNNSSKSVADYVKKVNDMNIPAGYEDFYTSSQATAMYIKEHYPGQTVYCMGTRSLIQELRESGLRVVTVLMSPMQTKIIRGYGMKIVIRLSMQKTEKPFICGVRMEKFQRRSLRKSRKT